MKTLQCVNYLWDTMMSALTRNQSIIDRIFISIKRAAKRGYILATVGQHGADCKVGGVYGISLYSRYNAINVKQKSLQDNLTSLVRRDWESNSSLPYNIQTLYLFN